MIKLLSVVLMFVATDVSLPAATNIPAGVPAASKSNVVALTNLDTVTVKLDAKTLALLDKPPESHWGETFTSALLGGVLAILGGWLVFRLQQLKDHKAQTEFNFRVVEAICCEVKTLKSIYDADTGARLRQHPAGEPYFRWLHISQNHFVVFESNAEHIGKIEPELASHIIEVYELMKLMVESLGVNRHHTDKLEKVNDSLQTRPDDAELVRIRQWLLAEMIRQAGILKELDSKLRESSEKFFQRFEEIKRLNISK